MKISNSVGLSADLLKSGLVSSIDADPLRISLRKTSIHSGASANIWMRKHGERIEYRPLMGPGSNARYRIGKNHFTAAGSWDGLKYECLLQLSEKSLSWEWSVDIQNKSGKSQVLDLIYVQDVGLKVAGSGPVNEYYVSHYLERRILEDPLYGSVVCCRQNMKEAGGHPWLIIACVNGAVAASTDGMQFYGRTYCRTGVPEGVLSERPGGEYAGESSVVALREAAFELPAGARHRSVFVAKFMRNHRSATSLSDLDRLPGLVREFARQHVIYDKGGWMKPATSLFNHPDFLQAGELSEAELERFFGSERRHSEINEGKLISFFSSDHNHIMLREKESLVDRPHGHIMQAAAGFTPDERVMSTTAFAFGVFNSHLTQGNTNFNTLFSVCNSQFNLSPETGQRIFIEIDGKFRLLGVPSAFETGLNSCRWIYRHGDHCFQVRTWTSMRSPQVNMDFRVLSGEGIRLLVTHDFDDLNGWMVVQGETEGSHIATPDPESMIAKRFPGARFRITVRTGGTGYRVCGDEILSSSNENQGDNLFILDIKKTASFSISITGEVCGEEETVDFEDPETQWAADTHDARARWIDLSHGLSLQGEHGDIAAIREILPWYGMNALIHYLTPYGLEQFSGAAWGTRDVAQGPVELLLAMQKYNEAKQVLRIIFSNQNPDGGWPQWWMFDSYREIRAHSAHGDIMYWCLIAVCYYIRVTGDFNFLDETLPFYKKGKASQIVKKSLGEHIDRLVKKVIKSFSPGTSLVQYGGGDWNDSLQPVNKHLAGRMISSWTVEMNYQAFRDYAEVCQMKGEAAKAREIGTLCERIKSDFNTHLIKDGVVAGYGLAEDDGSFSLLLHPTDERTGIKYSILPMNRGILSGIFTSGQARRHQALIEEHLTGPDGARLMDRPLRYNGGIQTLFQRAESSTFFGREIGLMYVHEHIRYAEALALTGQAEAFLKALRMAIPAGYREAVPCGDIRQSNTYYSSSDVIFRNRYEADRLYSEIKTGSVTLRGGWRVYSSGPGIYTGMIVTRLLGLRIEWGNVIIDPVMPYSLDGFMAGMEVLGRSVTLVYNVREGNYGPKRIVINGTEVTAGEEENPYRRGGAVLKQGVFPAMPKKGENRIEVWL
ncbi:MAG: amylo-alpha-1,6-glucosidase [Bacteroidales bacterium]|nr:amylo-alpha-1,6-glucosidase [Bacteroidales bacterium]MDT8373208.1 amylo-alpha-1,6-glucosidase [Bacteroidales bacterium]